MIDRMKMTRREISPRRINANTMEGAALQVTSKQEIDVARRPTALLVTSKQEFDVARGHAAS
jgi:hypothetical protein